MYETKCHNKIEYCESINFREKQLVWNEVIDDLKNRLYNLKLPKYRIAKDEIPALVQKYITNLDEVSIKVHNVPCKNFRYLILYNMNYYIVIHPYIHLDDIVSINVVSVKSRWIDDFMSTVKGVAILPYYHSEPRVDYGSFIYDLFRKIEVILLVFKELSDFEKDNLNDDIVETYIQNSEFMKNLLLKL